MVNAEKVQGAVTFGIRPEGYCGKSRTSDLGPWTSGFRLPASGFRLPASGFRLPGLDDRWVASVVSLHTNLDCERVRSDV
jgi:hypothetical protein